QVGAGGGQDVELGHRQRREQQRGQDREFEGEGGGGANGDEHQAFHAQGARLGGPDHQAELPREDHSFGRVSSLWVKKQIQSASASRSPKTGARSGTRRRKISASCWPRTACCAP